MENYLIHIGNKNSGRYPRGSGENPYQHQGFFSRLFGIKKKNTEPTKKVSKRPTEKDVSKDLDKSISNNKETVKRLTDTSSKMNDLQAELADDYDNSYKKMNTLTTKQKNNIEKKLHDEFGKGCDDEWFFNDMVEEHISSEIDSMIPKEVKSKRSTFDSLQDSYWKDVNSITDDVLKKYKGIKVKDHYGNKSDVEWVLNSIIDDKLDTRFNAYMSRHFDDYWVYDVDSRYKAADRLKKDFGMTMDDYNKKYGK